MIAAIDWGAWAVHFLWLFVGAAAGFLIAAVLCVSTDCDRVAEAQQARPDPRVRALEARLAESEAARTRAEAAKTFYYDLYCALLTEASRKAALRQAQGPAPQLTTTNAPAL